MRPVGRKVFKAVFRPRDRRLYGMIIGGIWLAAAGFLGKTMLFADTEKPVPPTPGTVSGLGEFIFAGIVESAGKRESLPCLTTVDRKAECFVGEGQKGIRACARVLRSDRNFCEAEITVSDTRKDSPWSLKMEGPLFFGQPTIHTVRAAGGEERCVSFVVNTIPPAKPPPLVWIQADIRDGGRSSAHPVFLSNVGEKAAFSARRLEGESLLFECTVTHLDGDYCVAKVMVRDSMAQSPWTLETQAYLRLGEIHVFAAEEKARESHQLLLCVKKKD